MKVDGPTEGHGGHFVLLLVCLCSCDAARIAHPSLHHFKLEYSLLDQTLHPFPQTIFPVDSDRKREREYKDGGCLSHSEIQLNIRHQQLLLSIS